MTTDDFIGWAVLLLVFGWSVETIFETYFEYRNKQEIKHECNSKNHHQQAIHREVLSQSQSTDPETLGEENNEPVG